MKKILFPVICIAALAVSCKKEGCTDPDALNYNSEAKKDDGSCTYDESDPLATQKQQVKETYANMALAVYEDAYTACQELQTACQAFVNAPSAATHQAAKEAWLDSREIYGQSEIFRFAEGPIDNASDGPEGLINAWPLDEAYIDYVDGAPNSGIINNTAQYPAIDINTLVTANENGGETNISLGFHAIEFLLWGQDFNSASAGQRSFTDFLTDGTGTASNQARRGQYLLVCCEVLLQGLNQVKTAWATGSTTNYRAEWLSMPNEDALRKMFNAIKAMSGFELSGERMYTAYDNQDQEDEHSCFSDNTHRDIALNAQGIGNLYNGEYTRKSGVQMSGYALGDLVAQVNSAKNQEFLALRAATTVKIAAMYIPFDQAIVLPLERPKVLEAVQALQAEEAKILEIAAEFGITF
ncbi:MAG: imelysin family protein [Bacteroidota bacterium]